MGYGGGDGEAHATVVVGVVWLLDGREGPGGEVGEGLGGGDGGRRAGVGSSRAGAGGPLYLGGDDAETGLAGRGPFWERGELEELLLLASGGVRVGVGRRAGVAAVLVPLRFFFLVLVLVLWLLGQAAVEPVEERLHGDRGDEMEEK